MTTVNVEDTAQAHEVRAIGGLKRETRRARAHHGCGRRGGSLRVLLNLQLALEHLDTLLGFFEPLQHRRRIRGRCALRVLRKRCTQRHQRHGDACKT